MRRLSALISIAAGLALVLAAGGPPVRAQRGPERGAAIDAVLQRAVERQSVPGVVAIAADRRGVIYSGAAGAASAQPARPMTGDAIFRIASMTKAVTSLALLQLVDEKKVALDDPASKFLPAFAKLSVITSFDANTYLYTSRALTYFDLARQYGKGRLVDALRGMSARTLLIAFSSDWLYPPSGSEEIADALRGLGKDVELHVIEAPYGHDCFLLEEARQTPMIQNFLAHAFS